MGRKSTSALSWLVYLGAHITAAPLEKANRQTALAAQAQAQLEERQNRHTRWNRRQTWRTGAMVAHTITWVLVGAYAYNKTTYTPMPELPWASLVSGSLAVVCVYCSIRPIARWIRLILALTIVGGWSVAAPYHAFLRWDEHLPVLLMPGMFFTIAILVIALVIADPPPTD